MKGILQWFKSGSKMKRWILVILIGIALTCYGMANILVQKEMGFAQVGKIIVIFVVGFTFIVLGLIFLNKRNMELFIEATDDRMKNKKNVNVKSLIFNKTIYDQGPNIVVIGGGAGLNTVLEGLKKYTNNLTAIVTVSEYGRMPSNSRRELNTLPFGDIKDSLISLSSSGENEMNKLFNHEFKSGRLRGLDFSDIFFTAMNEINPNGAEAIRKSNEVLKITGKVLPVTLEEMNICAELENGYVVQEKEQIPDIVSEKVTKINRVYLSPSNCKAAPGVIEAIKEADSIIIGPGSLYTNVIPNLLVNGVAKAIKESKAIKIYVNNIMTEQGQTDDYTVSDHINSIIEHCGEGIIDYCIYDTGEIVPEYIKMYNREGSDLVEQKINDVQAKKIKFIKKNISTIKDGRIRHDPNLVGESVITLICDDMKFQNKEDDPEYVMLNTKLREDKRINKLKKETIKNQKREEKRAAKGKKDTKNKTKQSKFSSKYSERIKSIKESDKKTKAKKNEQIQERK